MSFDVEVWADRDGSAQLSCLGCGLDFMQDDHQPSAELIHTLFTHQCDPAEVARVKAEKAAPSGLHEFQPMASSALCRACGKTKKVGTHPWEEATV